MHVKRTPFGFAFLASTFALGCRPAVDLEAEQAALLQLHEEQRVAHLEADADLLISAQAVDQNHECPTSGDGRPLDRRHDGVAAAVAQGERVCHRFCETRSISDKEILVVVTVSPAEGTSRRPKGFPA